MNLIVFLMYTYTILSLVNYVYCDNPVLCKLHQVIGQWEFVFDTDVVRRGDVDQFDTEFQYWDRLSCGRGQPVTLVRFEENDRDAQIRLISEIQNGPGASIEQAMVTSTIIDLTDDGNRVSQVGVDGMRNGEWTLVVHEGLQGFMDIDLGDFYQGMITFDTFFRYDNLVDEGEDVFDSV